VLSPYLYISNAAGPRGPRKPKLRPLGSPWSFSCGVCLGKIKRGPLIACLAVGLWILPARAHVYGSSSSHRLLLDVIKQRKTSYLGYSYYGSKYILLETILTEKIERKRGHRQHWLRNIRNWCDKDIRFYSDVQKRPRFTLILRLSRMKYLPINAPFSFFVCVRVPAPLQEIARSYYTLISDLIKLYNLSIDLWNIIGLHWLLNDLNLVESLVLKIFKQTTECCIKSGSLFESRRSSINNDRT